jgi:hypothetical protein
MTNDSPVEPPYFAIEPEPSGTSDEGAVGYLAPPGSPSGDEDIVGEAIERPAKVMRIGAMIKQLLEEVRSMELDSAGRIRLREIYERSVRELADTLSPELSAELDRIAISFGDVEPTDAEIRLAHAQLVGWLEGLFHGIQATLFAQQMAAQGQLELMRRRSLPAGPGEGGPLGETPTPNGPRPPGAGAYL